MRMRDANRQPHNDTRGTDDKRQTIMVKTSTTLSAKLVTAHARDLHIAPRKMRLVTNLVKNMNALDALTQLQHANKKAAPMLIKLIQSAVANAKNNFSLDPQHLYIKSITADMGKVMKRYFPRARGSAFEIKRKMSHINIVLEERKKGKGSKVKAGFLNKPKEEEKVENVDQQKAVHEKPVKEEAKKSQVFKTDEQLKMSKVANKRRLFNRKTGE
jgi:large subunit ribosomal protein L22